MAGLTAKDMVQVAYGYGLFTGGLGAHYGAERLGATVIPMSGGQTEKQVQLIQDFKPTAIMVTPSYCVSIIEKLEQQFGTARNTSLKSVFLVPSRGPTNCAVRLKSALILKHSIFMACLR